jgi:hypothetical protein
MIMGGTVALSALVALIVMMAQKNLISVENQKYHQHKSSG